MKMEENSNLYNEDELHAPEWLNAQFLECALQNLEKDKDVKIRNFEITPGTSKADHYGSIMFRVKLNYVVQHQSQGQNPAVEQQKFQSWIIKTMPVQVGQKKELLDSFTVFETEIKMYAETLPKMEAMLRAVGDDTVLCARCIYYTLKPQKCIVFEDLVQSGYKVISGRFCQLEEVQMALKKLAKIHATSYKLAQQGDASIPWYENDVFSHENIGKLDMMVNGVKLFKDVISQYDDLQPYIPHIEKIEKELLDNCLYYFEAGTRKVGSDIMVLNHGDFHTKNMMVKPGSTSNLQDLMLVDFQICCYGSAAIDLLYASVMLFSPAMRQHQRQELFYNYFTTFQQTLQSLGYTEHIPTISEFQIELLKHKSWELFLIMTLIAVNYIFTKADTDVAKYCEDENERRKALDNPDVIKELRTLLPRLLHEGYFESKQ